MNIPLMRPDIREEDLQAVKRVLESGMLVHGSEGRAMEAAFSAYVEADHAMAVANGTAALHLALMALNIGPGNEVIVPSFSYVATANVVEIMGAKTVFADIDPYTFNIDPSKIESLITNNTKAIIPVHEFGLACEIEKVKDICERHDLYLIEDAACAMGAFSNGKHVGSSGHFGCFSLHPRKAITTGEGGVVTTNDEKLAEKIQRLRNHGIDMSSGKMEFVTAGLNYRLTDFQAAMFNTQFKRFEDQLNRKQQIAAYFNKTIRNGIFRLPLVPEGKTHSWQTYHVLVEKGHDRDAMIQKLREKGIFTNYGAQCIPAQDYFRKKYGFDAEMQFPAGYNAFTQGLAIPLYNTLKDDEVNYIAETLNSIN